MIPALVSYEVSYKSKNETVGKLDREEYASNSLLR